MAILSNPDEDPELRRKLEELKNQDCVAPPQGRPQSANCYAVLASSEDLTPRDIRRELMQPFSNAPRGGSREGLVSLCLVAILIGCLLLLLRWLTGMELF